MDDKPAPVRRGFQFGLRWLLAVFFAASLVCGFVYQELRIRRLARELSQANQSEPVLLFHVPRRSTEPQIAGYVGGQFVETGKKLNLKTRRHHLTVAADGSGLVVDLNGRTRHCKTLHFDPSSGQMEVDGSRFFERLGVDYDLRPQ